MNKYTLACHALAVAEGLAIVSAALMALGWLEPAFAPWAGVLAKFCGTFVLAAGALGARRVLAAGLRHMKGSKKS